MPLKNNEKNYYFGISQKAIIYDPKEEKYLLVKAIDKYFFENYGPWDFVGGTMEQGEGFGETLKREIAEEAGKIKYEVTGLVEAEKMVKESGEEKVFLGNLVKYIDGEIKLDHEHSEYKWEKYESIMEGKEYKPWLRNLVSKAQERIESEKYLEGWKRCQADFENYKKYQSESQKELVKYACQNIVVELIPVLDNFHMSTDHIPEEQKESGWVVGIMHIQKQLENVLKDNGVEEIETKVGDEFNPEIHEAISDSNVSNEHSNDSNVHKVKKILLKGYKLSGKVLRPVKVIVE